ncbi:MAG: alpha-mannosidase [Candidatus Sericytochromatia bacterium]|nr:MAG: alpha-mannosidase [Candidatus Sericytochromatia bacterium]
MKTKVFIFSHVHWDREWYRTFQEFRFDLVKVIDKIFDLLQSEEYKYFILDGQTIVVEDYLEVRPKLYNTLKSWVMSGKLLIGPWYVLPDEFLVSGEAIIRNLLFGVKISNELGSNIKIGYLPDMFGHIAQMPQILKGFNLEYAILWRGVNPSKDVFFWEGLDKTKIISLHLTDGYYNTFIINYKEQEKDLKKHLTKLKEKANKNILFPNGGDHLIPISNFKEILNDISSKNKDYIFIESNLIDFFSEIDKNNINETIFGELKYPSSAYILPGVYSSRIYLKQKNFELQNILSNIVEPISVISWLHGDDYKEEFINLAWKKLLQNQPHDSICGCSTDQVHKEMLVRYDEANQIANKIVKDCLEYICSLFNLDKNKDYFILYNLSNWKYNAIIDFCFDTDNLNLENISILDENNNEIYFEIKKSYDTKKFVSEIDILPDWVNIKRFEILARIENFEPLSYKLLKILEKKSSIKLKNIFEIKENFISNSILSISVEKEFLYLNYNDRKYIVNKFIVTGDVGDEYNYSPPINDYLIKAKIKNYEIVENNYLSLVLKINYSLELPEKIETDRKYYVNNKVINQIETYLTLNRDEKKIYFKTIVNNKAEDFRLRVYFSQDIINKNENILYYDTAFGFLTKDLKINKEPFDVEKYKERKEETFAIQNYASLFSNDHGIALFTKGIPECELYQENDIFYLSTTLIRAIGWLSRDDLRTRGGGAGPSFPTQDSQCKGINIFEYFLELFDNDFNSSNLNKSAKQYSNNILIKQFKPKNTKNNYILKSLINLYPENLIITALKKSESDNGFIIRFYNPTQNKTTYTLSLEKKLNIYGAFLVNLNEDIIKNIELLDNKIQGEINEFEIITIQFVTCK